MSTNELIARLPGPARDHLANVRDNLQLLADLGYCDVALAVPDARDDLVTVADARPRTAADPVPATRVHDRLTREEEPEAYQAMAKRRPVLGTSRRLADGATGSTDAYPLGPDEPYAVLLRTYGEQVEATASRMETAFIDATRDLMQTLRAGPLLDPRTGGPFSTERRAGDGVLRVDGGGDVLYASPNAVSIMREAGVEGRVTGMRAAELPGGALGIAPMLGAAGGLATELELGGRTLGYRCIALTVGALVLVEDLTEARRRERELGVKEATIREVHHRVKNNLQTIASLLRMQARRSGSEQVRRALGEAVERASAMATVHDMLARSDEECVDFAEVARRVVGLVHSSVMGDDPRIAVRVSGVTGPIDAGPATSLALVLTELVHNSLEHAFGPRDRGTVSVDLARDQEGLLVIVRDDGRGLPDDFDPAAASGLGLSIVRTLVEEDLGGQLSLTAGEGAGIAIRVPLLAEGQST
ncbi:MAG: ATPase [Actinobacteria bacterium]|nr:ATPase [Actinomycetota bacterium]